MNPQGITKSHLIQANIPEDYWEVDWATYKGPEEASKLAWSYLDNLKRNKDTGVGMLLAGKVGTGKTTLLAIVLKYLARANWGVYMTSLSELIELIKRSWDDKDLNHNIDTLKHMHFLGLDDLGKEHAGPTGFSAVTFDNLLRYRVQHHLPTLFTTNLNRAEIKSRYGEAVLSLIEGKTWIIPVQGPDFRQEIQRHELTHESV